jgi:adenine-specific DNA-methyltransferase
VPSPKTPKQKAVKHASKRPIEQYDHKGKTRVNNPPVGLVTPKTDPLPTTRKMYVYDPHLDPQLQWAGKKERLSFDVPTVSLHVHERIDPRTIIEAVRKRNGNGRPVQGYLFETKEENPPLRDAIDFYRHPHGWSNRLVEAGGVEPPSEKRYGSKTTCLAQFRLFRQRRSE